MPVPYAPLITLTDNEQAQLESLTRAHTTPQALAFRRYSEEDRDVADEPRLSLVVLDLHQGATEAGLPPETERFVTGVLKQPGRGFRKHANMLIFLAPDQAGISA